MKRSPNLDRSADEWVELSATGAVAQIRSEGRKRVGKSERRVLLSLPGMGRVVIRHHWDFRDPVRYVVENIESANALSLEKLRRLRSPLLQHRREGVSDIRLGLARALHVKNGLLQNTLEGQCLDRLLVRILRHRLDGRLQIFFEVRTKLVQIDPAGHQNVLAFGVIGNRVEQVLEREMRVSSGLSLTIRDVQDHF